MRFNTDFQKRRQGKSVKPGTAALKYFGLGQSPEPFSVMNTRPAAAHGRNVFIWFFRVIQGPAMIGVSRAYP
jgi:hypothetical protein